MPGSRLLFNTGIMSSKTDYVDARISDPDFGVSAGPILNACADSLSWQRITLTSLNGFSGTVSFSAAKDLTSGDVTLYVSPNPITLSSGVLGIHRPRFQDGNFL